MSQEEEQCASTPPGDSGASPVKPTLEWPKPSSTGASIEVTMAEVMEVRRERRRALHQKQYGVPVLQRIREAKTEKELHTNLLRALTETTASESTKRKWRKAAERRLVKLRILIPGIVMPGRRIA